jgi:2EXR family protein
LHLYHQILPEVMSSSQHLKIFNPDQKALNEEVRIHLLPKLLTELRECIWKMFLQKNRVIQIQLIFKSFEDFIAPWDKKQVNSDGRMYGYSYDIYLEPYRPTSKLFQLCRESRNMALEFYRAHLSCRVSTNEFRAKGFSS